MNILTRTIDEWLKLLNGINQLKKANGYRIVNETIIILERMKDNKLSFLAHHVSLLNLFYNFKIDDIDVILKFLKSIEGIYSFDSVIEKIKEFESKYDIAYISFILDGMGKRKVIETYFMNNTFKKVYCSKNTFPREIIDFTSNGLNKVVINDDYPFIIEERNLNNNTGSRTLYTSNFILNTETLPLKEEMNIFNIKYERNNLFSLTILALGKYIFDGKVKLIIQDPNDIYLNDTTFNFNEKYTIRSDGNILGDNNILYPSKMNYLMETKLIVQNANFVVIAKIINNEVCEMHLIVKKDFLNSMYSLLDNEVISYLNMIKKIENVEISRLMVK